MSARLAPSLVNFRQWIYATWPHHDPKNDGWIGDASHQGRQSDHNPNSRGIVDAIDTDENAIHMPTLLVAAAMHPSTHYLIYEDREYSARDLYKPTNYDGSNKHATHSHTSIWQTVKAEQSKTPWYVSKNWATLMEGSTGRAVSEAQMYLNVYGALLSVDGHFGPKTEAAVKAYQTRFHVEGGSDGIIGVHTEHSFRTNNYHRM